MDLQMDLPAFRELPSESRAAQRALIVARIAGRPHRRPAIVLAVVVAVLVVTPAFALRTQIDFWSAQPAPERIQLEFEEMRKVFRPAGGLVPKDAREVTAITIDGERFPLWVAPTEDGRYCWHWHHVGACKSSLDLGLILLQSEVSGFAWAAGVVGAEDTERIEVRYEDGSRTDVPFVWVSSPIDAGFVLFDIPVKNEREGSRPIAFVALDGDGNEVARQPLRYAPPGQRPSRR
jgi:hypothetical protein